MTPQTVVDVGVARGTPGLYRALPGAMYYLVEPLEECRVYLESLLRTIRGQYFLVAAGSVDGEATFNVHTDLSGSSLFAQAEGETLDGSPRRVTTARLDSLLPETLEGPVLLKVDTQGNEIEVLEGLGARLDEMSVLILETSMMKFRLGVPELADLVAYCDARGWVVYDILEGHMRPSDGALAQVDLVMVPRDSELRLDQRFFTAEEVESYLRTHRAD